MRDREKHRMEHTEIYSTALWHLQEDVELSVLAQDLTKVSDQSPKLPDLHLTKTLVQCFGITRSVGFSGA